MSEVCLTLKALPSHLEKAVVRVLQVVVAKVGLVDELSLAISMRKWNTSLCEAVGKRLAQFAEPVDAILEV